MPEDAPVTSATGCVAVILDSLLIGLRSYYHTMRWA
jgi:hypothetical protein